MSIKRSSDTLTAACRQQRARRFFRAILTAAFFGTLIMFGCGGDDDDGKNDLDCVGVGCGGTGGDIKLNGLYYSAAYDEGMYLTDNLWYEVRKCGNTYYAFDPAPRAQIEAAWAAQFGGDLTDAVMSQIGYSKISTTPTMGNPSCGPLVGGGDDDGDVDDGPVVNCNLPVFGCMSGVLTQNDCEGSGGTVVSSCDGFGGGDYDDIIRQACETYVALGVYASVSQCMTDLGLGKKVALMKLRAINVK